MAIGALAVLALAGCNGQLSPEAKQLLTQARTAYQRNDNGTVVSLTSRFFQEHPDSVALDEAHYLRGMARFRLGKYPAAVTDFKRALDETRSDSIRALAYTQLGEIAFMRNELDRAEEFTREALQYTDPGEPPADKALYRLGCTLQRQGQWVEADERLGKVTFWFRDTELAKRARRRISARAWTVRAGTFTQRRFAEAAVRELRKADLPVKLQVEVRGGELVYLVEVGRFEDYSRAAAQLTAVRPHQSDAFVTVTR
jgi:TolA-binding protein